MSYRRPNFQRFVDRLTSRSVLTPEEQQVTQFGRSLEFSNGLFSNLNIETSRNDIVNQNAPQTTGATAEASKVQIVNFTIKCAYTPSKAPGSANSAPTTASAQAPGAPAPAKPTHPVQVAKN